MLYRSALTLIGIPVANTYNFPTKKIWVCASPIPLEIATMCQIVLQLMSLTFPVRPPLPSRTPISLHFSQIALTSATGNGCRLCYEQEFKSSGNLTKEVSQSIKSGVLVTSFNRKMQ